MQVKNLLRHYHKQAFKHKAETKQNVQISAPIEKFLSVTISEQISIIYYEHHQASEVGIQVRYKIVEQNKCKMQSEIGWALTLFMWSLFFKSRAD